MRPPDASQRTTEELIRDLRRSGDEALRREAICRHKGLVERLAAKFVRPGTAREDLTQTAWIGLIGAVDRFDSDRKTLFTTYATQCIVGVIKRYFRDLSWGLKVPRPLQEIAVALSRRQEQLLERLGRLPTMSDMAESFGVSEERLAEAMEVRHRCELLPLDEPSEEGQEGGRRPLSETVGSPDARIHDIVAHAPLHAALKQLDPRDRFILERRFYKDRSQVQIAAELNLSQRQVSRLERAALRQLHRTMIAEEAAAAASARE
jgi:RNA polymerase sigma-B factor